MSDKIKDCLLTTLIIYLLAMLSVSFLVNICFISQKNKTITCPKCGSVIHTREVSE